MTGLPLGKYPHKGERLGPIVGRGKSHIFAWSHCFQIEVLQKRRPQHRFRNRCKAFRPLRPGHLSCVWDAKWTESIAVGDKEFVMETKAKLGAKAIGRRELENNEGYELKELQSPYNRVFDPEKCSLRLKNDHIWEVS